MSDTNTAQLVVDLKATDDAVNAKGWVAPGLGVPGAPLGLLTSTLNPLGGLAAAGLSWFMPLVSFLGEPLTQLQGGDGSSVSAGSQDFGTAGQDMAGVADSYRASATAQTSGWSGAAATEYRDAATQHADGVAGLGQASNTVGSAIIGAGQVVAQAIAEVTELIAEAVAQIVPIMTQAIARAAETFGQSVVEAIPPCVAIAVEYALRIAAKLAALVASGDNLLKLVQGGMAVVELIQTAMTSISQQSVAESAAAAPGAEQGGASATGAATPETPVVAANGEVSSAAATSSTGGSGGSGTDGSRSLAGDMAGLGGGAANARVTNPLDAATQTAGWTPPPSPVPATTAPDASRLVGPTGGGVSLTGGAVPLGGGAAHSSGGPGTLRGGGTVRGGDTARQENKAQPVRAAAPSGTGTPGGVPMGAMGGRPGTSEDKEHERKYKFAEAPGELFGVEAPPTPHQPQQ